jgi:hypothetical protein
MKIARISPRVTSSTLMVGAAALLLASTACEKEATAPPQVAASNVTTPVASSMVAAMNGVAYNFANGAALSPVLATQPITVTFNSSGSATTATITGTGGTLQADVTFGSCVFTIRGTNSFGIPSGTVWTVNPCTLTLNTAGKLANDVTTTVGSVFTLGNSPSYVTTVPVTVKSDGSIIQGGVKVGTVSTTAATGSF